MSEFKYPMWFKFIYQNDTMVTRFDSLNSGEVIEKDKDNDRAAGEYSNRLIPHTDTNYWLNVTDQYKDKTEIPPLVS